MPSRISITTQPQAAGSSGGSGVRTRKRGYTPIQARVVRSRVPRGIRKKPLALKEHQFVERTEPFLIRVAPEASAQGLFRSFTLDECLQVAHYKAIFEYYRIDKVVVTFRYKGASTPAYTSVPVTSGGAQAAYNQEIINEINPVLYFKVDHNDATADSLNTMKESMRTKEHQFTNTSPSFSVVLKPAILAEAYKTPLSTAYHPKYGQWISMDDSNVPHYGLKAYAVAGLNNSPTMGDMEVQTKVYFSAKCNE